jgi:hypothetical protein
MRGVHPAATALHAGPVTAQSEVFSTVKGAHPVTAESTVSSTTRRPRPSVAVRKGTARSTPRQLSGASSATWARAAWCSPSCRV